MFLNNINIPPNFPEPESNALYRGLQVCRPFVEVWRELQDLLEDRKRVVPAHAKRFVAEATKDGEETLRLCQLWFDGARYERTFKPLRWILYYISEKHERMKDAYDITSKARFASRLAYIGSKATREVKDAIRAVKGLPVEGEIDDAKLAEYLLMYAHQERVKEDAYRAQRPPIVLPEGVQWRSEDARIEYEQLQAEYKKRLEDPEVRAEVMRRRKSVRWVPVPGVILGPKHMLSVPKGVTFTYRDYIRHPIQALKAVLEPLTSEHLPTPVPRFAPYTEYKKATEAELASLHMMNKDEFEKMWSQYQENLQRQYGQYESTLSFLRDALGMRVLRHEEFNAGCEATCNGPYARPWSKTMIGWGDEYTSFVFELTYNYGIKHYEHGDDLRYIALSAPATAIAKAKELGFAVESQAEFSIITDADGYKWLVKPSDDCRVDYVSINVSSIENAEKYYAGVLGMKVFDRKTHENGDISIQVGYEPNQTRLELYQRHDKVNVPINHAAAFGRIAIGTKSGPQHIYEKVTASKDVVQHGPIKLDTPGKATVEVVILQDRDGYEICFVGQDAFDELCKPFPGCDKIDWEQRKELGAD